MEEDHRYIKARFIMWKKMNEKLRENLEMFEEKVKESEEEEMVRRVTENI